jgi:hypothetical protein
VGCFRIKDLPFKDSEVFDLLLMVLGALFVLLNTAAHEQEQNLFLLGIGLAQVIQYFMLYLAKPKI